MDGEVYERVIDGDGNVQIPEDEAAKEVCVFMEPGAVLGYFQIQSDGTVEVGKEHAHYDVKAVVPSDEQFERHNQQ